MPKIRSGLAEGYAYSLSRWTDLPAAKWAWFETRLKDGGFFGIDPLSGVPHMWSLRPEETLGLIFWTRDSRNLLKNYDLLKPYQKVVHFSLTGWHEVETGAPGIEDGLAILRDTVAAFGPSQVRWRLSPVPVIPDTLSRFAQMANEVLKMGLKEVYVAFLQNNDFMTDTRTVEEKVLLLEAMAQVAPELKVILCEEDATLRQRPSGLNQRINYGICEDGGRFAIEGGAPKKEGCGCALVVDPFTINESCVFGCKYCYAADKSLSPRKHNTTRGFLPVVH